MLNRLAGATGKFIPVSSLLLDVLRAKELSRAPQTSTGKPADFGSVLKVAKSVVRTPSFQHEVVAQVLELLCEHLHHWGFSPAFPELLHVPIVALRRCRAPPPPLHGATRRPLLPRSADGL